MQGNNAGELQRTSNDLQFPEEILYNFLKFLGVSDLLNCRSVNSNFNQLACRRLRSREEFSVSFDNDESITSFFAITFNRIQPLQFGTFKFEGHHPSRLIFDAFGSSIFNCVLELKQALPLSLRSFLKVMPNLEKLRIFGPGLKLDWVNFAGSPELSRIRSLGLHRACDQQNHDNISLYRVKSWISEMPKLMEFETGFTIFIDSAPAFLQFVSSISPLSIKVKVKFLVAPALLGGEVTKVGLKLYVSNDGLTLTENSNVSTWINIFAPCFKLLGLNISAKGPNITNALPNLNTLRLHCNQSVNERFKPEFFPSLHKVIINYKGPYTETRGIHFRGTIFPNVESFYIIGGFRMDGEPVQPWEKIFPNVKNFRVGGKVLQCHFDRFTVLFKRVVQLNITSSLGSDYSYNPFSLTAICESVLRNPKLEVAQRFKNARLMPKLKRLELVGYDQKMLMDLVMLTQWKVMAALDFLGMYRFDRTENLQTLGKALLGKTNWHKEIKFESTYDEQMWEE